MTTIREYFDSSYLARIILDNNENELYNTLYINLINYDISSERSEDEKYSDKQIEYIIEKIKEKGNLKETAILYRNNITSVLVADIMDKYGNFYWFFNFVWILYFIYYVKKYIV